MNSCRSRAFRFRFGCVSCTGFVRHAARPCFFARRGHALTAMHEHKNCQKLSGLWLRSSTVRLDYCRLASPEIRSDMPGPHLEEQQGYIQNFLGSFAMQKSLTTDENVLCLLLCGLCAFRKKLIHAQVAYLILYIYIYTHITKACLLAGRLDVASMICHVELVFGPPLLGMLNHVEL